MLERADGRHCVAEWLRFMIEFHLKRGEASANATGGPENDRGDAEEGIIKPPTLAGSQADWQKAILHETHETKRTNRLTIEGTLIVAAELEVPLGATFAAIQTKLSQYPARAARRVVGLRDVGEAEDVLRDEMDADLTDLHAATYIDAAVPEVLAALPFDEDSARLLKLVIFDGQDTAALRELIARVAIEALRLIGRRGLSVASTESPGAASTIPEAAVSDDEPRAVTRPAAASESAKVSARAESPRAAAPKASEKVSPGKKSPAGAKKEVKRKRKPRRQPAIAPREIEAVIVKSSPRPKHRKSTRRRKA